MRATSAESRSGASYEPRSVPFARFDDLHAGGGLVFASSTPQTLVAADPEEVVPVLRAVEEATA